MGSPTKSARKRRRRLIRFDLHKAMFVLPNLFTVSNIFCGFYAVTLCMGDPQPKDLYRAAIAIFFGMFFDMFDGRVARLTRTQSEFGVQLDSLADLVTFGVAPGILLYRWTLAGMEGWGIFIAFAYVACGALRLARFNVLASREPGSMKHFLGLPIPLAAGTVVALVMSSYPYEQPTPGGARGVALVTLLLGALMVSNVRYRTFKDLRPSKKSITLSFMVVLLFAAVSAQLKPSIALAALFMGYITLGLIEEVVFFRRRRAESSTEEEHDDSDNEFEDAVLDDDDDLDEPQSHEPRPA